MSHEKSALAQKLQNTCSYPNETPEKEKTSVRHCTTIIIWQLAIALNIGRKLASQCVIPYMASKSKLELTYFFNQRIVI